MNICARVTSALPAPAGSANAGKVSLGLEIASDGGHQLATAVLVAISASAAVLNSSISDRIKQAFSESFGVTVTPQDTIRVFGGAVN